MAQNLSNEVLPYDFRDHFFLSLAQLESLAILHKQFAHIAIENISNSLHYHPKINLEQVKQQPFSLFLKSCSPASFHTLIDLAPFPSQGLITFNLDLCYDIIDRVLGGQGGLPSLCKPFNDLEMAIQRKFIKILLNSLKNAWKSHLDVDFDISELCIDPETKLHISRMTKCAVLIFSYEHCNLSTYFYIVIPCQSLRGFDNMPLQEKTPSAINENIDPASIPLELKTRLGTFELAPSELEMLQVNDIIKLNTNINHPLSVLVHGQPLLMGLPGLLHQQKGVLLL